MCAVRRRWYTMQAIPLVFIMILVGFIAVDAFRVRFALRSTPLTVTPQCTLRFVSKFRILVSAVSTIESLREP